jgi:hypothetical protein
MRGLAVAALAPAVVWALRLPKPSVPPDATLELSAAPPTESAPASVVAQTDPKVFAVRLWNPEPPAPRPMGPLPSSPRAEKPNVVLVAIIETDGRLRAALYDPAEQRVRVLQVGAAIGQYTVSEITPTSAIVRDGQWTYELRLREERPPSPIAKLFDLPLARTQLDP